MTFPLFLRRPLAAALVLCLVAGCDLMKRNQDALAVINARAIGMPAGEFFDRFGRPERRRDLPDGAIEFLWSAPVVSGERGWAYADEHICKLRLITDKRNRIASVEILYDAQGKLKSLALRRGVRGELTASRACPPPALRRPPTSRSSAPASAA